MSDLNPLFKAHPSSRPTSTISSLYDKDFLRWFVFSSYAQWGVPDQAVDEKTHYFKVEDARFGNYFASVFVVPYLEGWLIVQNRKISTAILVLGSYKEKPYISSGRLDIADKKESSYKKIVLDLDNHALQHIWPPEFQDLDKDGIPELWLRYNYTTGTGFTQELAIYKLKNGEWFLLKKFTGQFEGIARRLAGNTVEVASGFSSQAGMEHSGYNQHHFETWVYREDDFTKINEWDVPHILLNASWRKYYLDEKD